MAEKVTRMLIKVDLQCSRCYEKIKKILREILRKIPQSQEPKYDEKQNTVLITVVYCCPEKIRRKIIRKGGGKTVLGVEILPDKPKEPEKPKDTTKPKVVIIEPLKKTAKPPPRAPVPAPPRTKPATAPAPPRTKPAPVPVPAPPRTKPAPVPVPALPRTKPAPPKPPQQVPTPPPSKVPKPVVGYPPVPGYPVVWGRPVVGAVKDVGDQPMRVKVKIEVAFQGRGGQ